MNTTEKFFVEMLRGFATGETPQLNTEGIDTEQLLQLAKSHSVQGIIFHMLERCKIVFADDVAQTLTKAFNRTVMQMVHRENAAIALCDILTQNRIPHILFKGFTVSETYPVKELRTYGDVDILVRKEDVRKARELMKSMNFEHSVADEGIVNVYDKGREHYEFHTALNVATIKNNSYFSDIWEHTVLHSGETRVFEHNFHLCYLISHIEKHVYGSGAGIKMYLDIAAYINKYRSEINLDKVRDTLVECGLGQFLNTVLYLCNRWFSLEIPQWVVPLSDAVFEQMCQFTLSGGIFGTEDNLNTSLRRRLSSGTKGVKMRTVLGRMFPPFSELCRIYPRYQDKPLLTPVAWFEHIIHIIKDRKLVRVKEIASADIDSLKDRNKFFESIGSKR